MKFSNNFKSIMILILICFSQIIQCTHKIKHSRIYTRRRTKGFILEYVKFLFNAYTSTGSQINNKIEPLEKVETEIRMLSVIWKQCIKSKVNIEKSISKITFFVNNPFTALLLKIKEKTIDQENSYLKPKIKEKKEEEKTILDQKHSNSVWINKGRDFLASTNKLEVLSNEIFNIDKLNDFLSRNFETVLNGFFEEILNQFSPISLMNFQDPQIQEKMELYIKNSYGAKGDQNEINLLEPNVKKFIQETAKTCASDTSTKIMQTSKEVILEVFKVLQTHFPIINTLIVKLNKLIVKSKSIKEIAQEIFSSTQMSIIDSLKTIDEDFWNAIKNILTSLIDSIKECFSTHEANLTKFAKKQFGSFVASTIGGMMDSVIKTIPGVSQLIGLINSILSIFNFWKIASIADYLINPISSLEIPVKKLAKNLGKSLAKFTSDTLRSLLGLTNLPGVENLFKSGYGIYVIALDLVRGKSDRKPKLMIINDPDIENPVLHHLTINKAKIIQAQSNIGDAPVDMDEEEENFEEK